MSKALARVLAVLVAVTLLAAACSDDNKTSSGDGGGSGGGSGGGGAATDKKIDYESIGLWDDGPCDAAKPPLTIGLMTVFESPLLTLKDQATALEVAATAFNKRGGANGSCIKVFTCDDKADPDQALACVRELDGKGIVATVNDQGTAGQADVSKAMQTAKIPRVASNVTQDDWGDPNAYPIDASGTGVTFMMPSALVDQGVKKIGVIRVDLAAASALVGLLGDLYKKDGVTFVSDQGVPSGTTDFNQFILGAQDKGAEGIVLPLGEQEAVQVLKAGQQLGTDLKVSASLGTFSYKNMVDFGDFAGQMTSMWAFPPATFDLPVYDALRQDLASTDDPALQPETLKASPMRSWIGLYALLKMIRDQKVTDFTRENMTKMLKAAKDVPMLGMFGEENWTPDKNHEGLFVRAGVNRWSSWNWDPAADWNGEKKGNWAKGKDVNWDELMCGSIFGAPADTCG